MKKKKKNRTVPFFITFLILICIFFTGCSTTHKTMSSDTDDLQDLVIVINILAEKMNKATQPGRLMRLAVLEYISTKKPVLGESNEFGEYFAESLVSALKEDQEKIKLFERNRLNLVLKENALTLSGIINESQAKKIGELVPIDAILSGTYTKLKNYIDINSRLIDVVTGEILLTHSARVKLTDDLSSLFKDEFEEPSKKDICLKKEKKINLLMGDISTADKIKTLVDEAVKIPFDLICGRIHFSVMALFRKYEIENADYKTFLTNEISVLSFPSDDSRARAVLKYLVKDSVIDSKEWDFGLNVIKKSRARAISGYLSVLLNLKPMLNLKETYQRIDKYFSLVKDNKIGLPMPVDFDTGFSEMTEAFNYIYNEDNRVLIYCYSKYKKDLSSDKKIIKRINTLLTKMYFRETNKKEKEKILNWICEFFNQRHADEDLGNDMFDFTRRFKITSYMKKNPEKIKEVPQVHLKKLIKLCKAQFCNVLPHTKYKYPKQERIDFCLENNIDCPGIIPTVDECINMLSSSDWDVRIKGMEILVKMKNKAKKAEKQIIRVLKAKKLKNETNAAIAYKHAMIILGNIKTTNPEALDLLITSLGSLYSQVPTMAMGSLVRIGKPAVPYLIKGLKSKFGSVQYKAAKALGMIGPDAKKSIPALRKLLKSNNRSIYNAAKDAIVEIGE